MSELVAYALNAMLALVLVVVLAPLSKELRDHGAPEAVAMVPLGIAGLALLVLAYFLYCMVRTARKVK